MTTQRNRYNDDRNGDRSDPGPYDRDLVRDDDDHKRSDDIRAEIRQTRSHLDSTLDQLQQRLDPKEVMHSAFQTLRDNSGDVVNRAICTVKQNPIPTALIGIGVIWLLMNQSKRSTELPSELEYEEFEGYGERFRPVVYNPTDSTPPAWQPRPPSSGTFQEGQHHDV